MIAMETGAAALYVVTVACIPSNLQESQSVLEVFLISCS